MTSRRRSLKVPSQAVRARAVVALVGVFCAGASIAVAGPTASASAPSASPAGPAVPWSPVPVQSPPGGMSTARFLSLGNVSCTSNTDCVVAGYLESSNPAADSYPPKAPPEFYQPVLWHWDGHVWAYQASGTKGSVGLVGSACASASDCWAVGGQFVGKLGNQSVGVIVHYGGKSWSSSTFPSPAGAAFNGVACTSASDCLVAGNRQTSATSAHVLVEHWDGKAWSALPAPSPKAALWSVLESLTCYTAADCLALGDADNSTKGSGYFFAERFNGTSWSMVPAQNAQQFNMGNDSGLFEIACPSQTDCLAVGAALGYTHGQMGADFPGGVAEHWDGASWSALKPTPQLDGANLVMNGASCTSAKNCWVALGFPSILGPLNHDIPIAHWDGSHFSVSTLTTKGFLAGISCLPEKGATWCVGLGEGPKGATAKGATMTGGDFSISQTA